MVGPIGNRNSRYPGRCGGRTKHLHPDEDSPKAYGAGKHLYTHTTPPATAQDWWRGRDWHAALRGATAPASRAGLDETIIFALFAQQP